MPVAASIANLPLGSESICHCDNVVPASASVAVTVPTGRAARGGLAHA